MFLPFSFPQLGDRATATRWRGNHQWKLLSGHRWRSAVVDVREHHQIITIATLPPIPSTKLIHHKRKGYRTSAEVKSILSRIVYFSLVQKLQPSMKLQNSTMFLYKQKEFTMQSSMRSSRQCIDGTATVPQTSFSPSFTTAYAFTMYFGGLSGVKCIAIQEFFTRLNNFHGRFCWISINGYSESRSIHLGQLLWLKHGYKNWRIMTMSTSLYDGSCTIL